ncbi:hypothetical protein GZH49_37565 [Nocardia terpenica]
MPPPINTTPTRHTPRIVGAQCAPNRLRRRHFECLSTRREPKPLRLQLFSIPARLAQHARRVHLRLSRHHRRTGLLLTALDRLQPG